MKISHIYRFYINLWENKFLVMNKSMKKTKEISFKQTGINLTELKDLYYLSEEQCKSIVWLCNNDDSAGWDIYTHHNTIMLGKSPMDYDDGDKMMDDMVNKYMCFYIKYSNVIDKKTLKGLRELIIGFC